MKCDTLALFNINFRDFAINENRKTDIFLSVSKAKENLLLYFPPFDTIFRYQAVFYYQKGEFYHYDRYRKSALAGPAPIGGSSSTEPSERTKGKNTQAHSDRGNSGKGAAGGANDGAASIGGIPITKNTAKRLKHSEGLRETGGRFLFPKGALTHHLPEAGGGIPPVGRERALSEGDFAFCGKRQTMPQHLPCCCHCLRSCLCRTELAVQTAACENLATGSFVAEMDSAWVPSIFSFAKEKQKRERGDTLWQSTIWRQRWSAVGLAAPLPRRRPI